MALTHFNRFVTFEMDGSQLIYVQVKNDLLFLMELNKQTNIVPKGERGDRFSHISRISRAENDIGNKMARSHL